MHYPASKTPEASSPTVASFLAIICIRCPFLLFSISFALPCSFPFGHSKVPFWAEQKLRLMTISVSLLYEGFPVYA